MKSLENLAFRSFQGLTLALGIVFCVALVYTIVQLVGGNYSDNLHRTF
jgi:hypothetical protein